MTLDIEAARDLLTLAEQDDASSWTITRGLGFLVGGWRLSATRPDRIVDHVGNTFSDHSGSIVEEPYAQSLDAITDLIERTLPNCAWGVSVEPPTSIKPPFDVTYHAYIADHWPHLTGIPARWQGEASYRKGKALALCIAFVEALISKAGMEGADG